MATRNFIAVSAIALMAASVLTASATAAPAPVNLSNPHHEFVDGVAPQSNVSPMENGFSCFAAYLAKDPRRPAFSVGHITDHTGKFSNEASAGGFEVTQGLADMVYTALGKMAPDFNIVERSDTSITDAEIGLAKQSLLGDVSEPGNPTTGAGKGLRVLRGGQFEGTDYFITGAITEINYNIDSGGVQVGINQIGAGKRVYSMSVAMDLRIVDAKTLRVVKTVSERKIIRGYETQLGVFNFLGNYLIDINAGKKAQEPIELGVRATMEAALLKLVGAAYQTPYGETCSNFAETNYGNVQADPIGAVLTTSTK